MRAPCVDSSWVQEDVLCRAGVLSPVSLKTHTQCKDTKQLPGLAGSREPLGRGLCCVLYYVIWTLQQGHTFTTFKQVKCTHIKVNVFSIIEYKSMRYEAVWTVAGGGQ